MWPSIQVREKIPLLKKKRSDGEQNKGWQLSRSITHTFSTSDFLGPCPTISLIFLKLTSQRLLTPHAAIGQLLWETSQGWNFSLSSSLRSLFTQFLNSFCHLNATPWMPSRRDCAPFSPYLNYQGYCSKIWTPILTTEWSYFNPKYHIFLNQPSWFFGGKPNQTVTVCWG